MRNNFIMLISRLFFISGRMIKRNNKIMGYKNP